MQAVSPRSIGGPPMICAAAFCIFTSVVPVDGDTFDAGSPWLQRYRVWGANTPERGEPGFDAATEALRDLTKGGIVCRQAQASQTYGRDVVQCWNGQGQDIACELIRSGHAEEVLRYSGGYYRGCGE